MAMNKTLEHLRYPIGRFQIPDNINESALNGWMQRIESLPVRLRAEVEGLTDDQLAINYRPGGWTIRQIINHVPDSHMNAYIRFKLALTEDRPVIRPYYEDRWAELPDGKNAPVNISMSLLESLHARWCLLLKSLSVEDLNKMYIHPEHNKEYKLKEVIGMYAWHGDHHLAHIILAKEAF
jgi:hypothetical protein